MIEVVTFNNVPDPSLGKTVFLGGSTAKGDWQEKVIERLSFANVNVVNTSRPDWNIKPPTEHEKKSHSRWEMFELYLADYAFIYIPADAKSPTVLLELGIALSKGEGNVWVAVDRDYPWYDNVLEACSLHGSVVQSFEEALDALAYRCLN